MDLFLFAKRLSLSSAPTLLLLLSLLLLLLLPSDPCSAQSMSGDANMGSEQDTAAELEQMAIDNSNPGQMPEGHGYGRNIPNQGNIDRDNAAKDGGRGPLSRNLAGGVGGGGGGPGKRGGAKGAKAKGAKAKGKEEDERSFSEQTEQAIMQFGVLVRTEEND